MARVLTKSLTIPIGKKDPLYPLNVLVHVIYPNWKRHKAGVITREYQPGPDGDRYLFTITAGYARGKQYYLGANPPQEVLVDGEPWDIRIRA